MPIEMESPVSRLISSIPERLPAWAASVGSAVSFNSLMACSNSVFLSLDRITPACISHLHERKCAWNGCDQKEAPVGDQVLAASPLFGGAAEIHLWQRAQDHDLVVLDRDLHSRKPAVWESSGKPTLDRTELFGIHDYNITQ